MNALIKQTVLTIEELPSYPDTHGFVIEAAKLRANGFPTAFSFVKELFDVIERSIVVSEHKETGDVTIKLDNAAHYENIHEAPAVLQ